jgi:hypothetical protein
MMKDEMGGACNMHDMREKKRIQICSKYGAAARTDEASSKFLLFSQ